MLYTVLADSSQQHTCEVGKGSEKGNPNDWKGKNGTISLQGTHVQGQAASQPPSICNKSIG